MPRRFLSAAAVAAVAGLSPASAFMAPTSTRAQSGSTYASILQRDGATGTGTGTDICTSSSRSRIPTARRSQTSITAVVPATTLSTDGCPGGLDEIDDANFRDLLQDESGKAVLVNACAPVSRGRSNCSQQTVTLQSYCRVTYGTLLSGSHHMHKCSSLSLFCLILVCNIIVVRTLQIDQASGRTSGGQVGQGRARGQVRRGERGRGAVQGHAARRAGGENIGPPDADTAQGRAARIVPERRRDGHGRQHVFESESAQGADSDCRWQ